MLERIVDSSFMYYVIGVMVVGGVISKLVVGISLNRLVKAASNMSKSTHGFMKLVRAKYEHAHMVNDHVENTEVFLEKYIHEYKVLGVCLYGWLRLKKIFAILLCVFVAAGMGTQYYVNGLGEPIIELFGIGGVLFVGLMLVYQLGDDNFKVKKMKIYMVDYLENVCALRYERESGSKQKVIIPDYEQEEILSTRESLSPMSVNKGEEEQVSRALEHAVKAGESGTVSQKEKQEEAQVKTQDEKRITLTMVEKLLLEEAERREEIRKKKSEEHMPNEATIREILQEFMA